MHVTTQHNIGFYCLRLLMFNLEVGESKKQNKNKQKA